MKARDFKLTWRKTLLGTFAAWTLTTYFVDDDPFDDLVFSSVKK